MKYGPDLPRSPRFFARLGRTLQVFGLGALAVFLFSLALSLYSVFPLVQLSPVELYHQTWQTARDHSYDPKALKDWDSLEHKYDHLIKTQADAVKYANEALRGSGDHYAVFLDPSQAKAERDRMQGQFSGIGINVLPMVDDNGELLLGADKSRGPLMRHDADGHVTVDVVEGGPAASAGIKSGDAVVAIGGKSTVGFTMDDFVKNARGLKDSSVTLTIKRDGKQFDITVVRGIVKTPSVTSKLLTAPNGKQVGYIRLESFIQQSAPREMFEALQSLKSADRIIVDLRFNPGGDVQVCVQLMSMFIRDGELVSMRERTPGGGHYKQTYVAHGSKVIVITEDETTGAKRVQALNRPPALGLDQKMVVLVNGNSASASEMFTGAMKDHDRAVIVGERTFGKGIGQTVIPMPNGTILHITSLRYFTPKGTWLGDGGNGNEKFGVEPDVTLKFNEEKGAKFGDPKNDNQLAKALEIVSQ